MSDVIELRFPLSNGNALQVVLLRPCTPHDFETIVQVVGHMRESVVVIQPVKEPDKAEEGGVDRRTCPDCAGSGKVDQLDSFEAAPIWASCPACQGTGVV